MMPGVQLHYAVPGSEAADEVVAYYWPPFEGGTGVLFQDGEKVWIPVEEGQAGLTNPRTVQPIR